VIRYSAEKQQIKKKCFSIQIILNIQTNFEIKLNVVCG
jgi:hypothetical protein